MLIATTIHRAPVAVSDHAKERAEALGIPYRERGGNILEMKETDADTLLVYGKRGVTLLDGENTYAYHTGTAAVRLLSLQRGERDRLCALLPSGTKTVLDATFGEGKDSLVLSYFLGEAGRVTALEKSAALYEIGRDAIVRYQDQNADTTAALRRISLLHADMREFLERAAPESFDVVYIDTMFRVPVNRETVNAEAFRAAAAKDTVDGALLSTALRVAAKAVIVKERPFSQIFRTFSFTELEHKKGQPTAYGVIFKEGAAENR